MHLQCRVSEVEAERRGVDKSVFFLNNEFLLLKSNISLICLLVFKNNSKLNLIKNCASTVRKIFFYCVQILQNVSIFV